MPSSRWSLLSAGAVSLLVVLGGLTGCSSCGTSTGASGIAQFSATGMAGDGLQLTVCRDGACVTSGAAGMPEGGVRVEKTHDTEWTVGFIDKGAPDSFDWSISDASGTAHAQGTAHPVWSDGCNPVAVVSAT